MAHFHYIEDTIEHCKRWFCDDENKTNDVMEAYAEVESYRKNKQFNESLLDNSSFGVSAYVAKANEETFEAIVPSNASDDAHRKALWGLAVVRWTRFRKSGWANPESPENEEQLPAIFSYVNELGQTVYFFKSSKASVGTIKSDPSFQPNALIAEAIQDTGVKIPVTKLPAVAAKKLFG